jgi:phosphate transport system substrate-binding protein
VPIAPMPSPEARRAATIVPAAAEDISGAGATFPYPIYGKWADVYKKETGVGLNYQSIGSGGGIKQIEARTVTFGATDAPLKGEELDKNGLVQFPMVMGGIVPVINLEGVKAGDLVIDGPTLAKIFLGDIKTWHDPAIKKAQSECQAAVDGDRRRAPVGWLRDDLQFCLLPRAGQR